MARRCRRLRRGAWRPWRPPWSWSSPRPRRRPMPRRRRPCRRRRSPRRCRRRPRCPRGRSRCRRPRGHRRARSPRRVGLDDVVYRLASAAGAVAFFARLRDAGRVGGLGGARLGGLGRLLGGRSAVRGLRRRGLLGGGLGGGALHRLIGCRACLCRCHVHPFGRAGFGAHTCATEKCRLCRMSASISTRDTSPLLGMRPPSTIVTTVWVCTAPSGKFDSRGVAAGKVTGG